MNKMSINPQKNEKVRITIDMTPLIWGVFYALIFICAAVFFGIYIISFGMDFFFFMSVIAFRIVLIPIFSPDGREIPFYDGFYRL